jgi:hypothetical protein
MRIRTSEDYRRALEELKRTGADSTRRHELEAAVGAFAQEHNNSRVRRGRPPARQTAGNRKFPED